MACFILWFFTMGCFLITDASTQVKTKRQIFREQVLPHQGGRIPDGAFNADRLLLNRLNKEGIAVPDGVLLEHRPVHSHPHPNKHDPEDEKALVRIIQQPENRFTAPEGRYHHDFPMTVASTYIIRKPVTFAETQIKTPNQVQTLDQFILYKQLGLHQPTSFQPHLPQRYASSPLQQQQPVNYQHDVSEHHHHFEVYHPAPVSFTLPNKERNDERFYENNHNSLNNLDLPSGRIDWPLLPREFGSSSDDLNILLQQNDLEFPYYLKNQNELEPFNGFFNLQEPSRFYRSARESYFKSSVHPSNKWQKKS